MRKIVLVYGLICGAILASMIFVMMAYIGESVDFEKGEIIGNISMILGFSMVFLGIRKHRDTISGGYISFNTAFRTGILITLIGCICYVGGWLIYFNFIDSSFIEKYSAFFINKINASGKSAADIQNEIAAFKQHMVNYNNPGVMSLYTFLEVFPMGLIITIICSFMMKRSPEK